jgi:hypothetical protein
MERLGKVKRSLVSLGCIMLLNLGARIPTHHQNFTKIRIAKKTKKRQSLQRNALLKREFVMRYKEWD